MKSFWEPEQSSKLNRITRMLDLLPLILPWRPSTVCTMMLATSQPFFLIYIKLSELLIGSWGATQHIVHELAKNRIVISWISLINVLLLSLIIQCLIGLPKTAYLASIVLIKNSLLITYLQCLFNLLKINLNLQSQSLFKMVRCKS